MGSEMCIRDSNVNGVTFVTPQGPILYIFLLPKVGIHYELNVLDNFCCIKFSIVVCFQNMFIDFGAVHDY